MYISFVFFSLVRPFSASFFLGSVCVLSVTYIPQEKREPHYDGKTPRGPWASLRVVGRGRDMAFCFKNFVKPAVAMMQ